MKKKYNSIDGLFGKMKNQVRNTKNNLDEISKGFYDKEKMLDYDRKFMLWLIGIPATSFVVFLSNFDKFIVHDLIYAKSFFIFIVIVSFIVLLYYGMFFILYHSYMMWLKLTLSNIVSSLEECDKDFINLGIDWKKFMNAAQKLDTNNEENIVVKIEDMEEKLTKLNNDTKSNIPKVENIISKVNNLYIIYSKTKIFSFLPLLCIVSYIICFVIVWF